MTYQKIPEIVEVLVNNILFINEDSVTYRNVGIDKDGKRWMYNTTVYREIDRETERLVKETSKLYNFTEI